jgi:hypothetical protein
MKREELPSDHKGWLTLLDKKRAGMCVAWLWATHHEEYGAEKDMPQVFVKTGLKNSWARISRNRVRSISLAAEWSGNVWRFYQVVVHETCHHLVGLQHNHDWVFKNAESRLLDAANMSIQRGQNGGAHAVALWSNGELVWGTPQSKKRSKPRGFAIHVSFSEGD